jgi:AP endonuclease-1
MVLETPVDTIDENGKKIEDKGIWAREIKMLENLVGMDVESDEFKELEAKLQDEGKGEREKIGGQVDRKKAKDAKPKDVKPKGAKSKEAKPAEAKPKKSRKKKIESEEEDEDEE